MDPNLFHLDWDRTFEVIAGVVVLSFFLERALSLVFEHKLFLEKLGDKGVKVPIAFALALGVCWFWDFDALSMIMLKEKTTFFGQAVTAGVVAGGSKGAVKLFRDLLGIKSTAYKEYEEQREAALRKRTSRAREDAG